MPQIMLNGPRLQTVATSSATADAITRELLNRKKRVTYFDVRNAKLRFEQNGQPFNEQEALNYLKSLQDLGLGVIVYSSNKRPQFRSFYSMRLVAQAAIEGKEIVATQINEAPKPKASRKPTKKRRKRIGRPPGAKNKVQPAAPIVVSQPLANKTYVVHVRKGLNIKVDLPAGFTKADVDNFAEGLKSFL